MPVPKIEGQSASAFVADSTSLGMFPKWVCREIAWA